ncbi:hypothetical protein SIM13_28710 [Bacillus cereus group sp. BfR-BA-01233]|uniref:hypothetical protein n=1 Tax=Bacillus cereus group sp. BfR-BA-01233 TaxID=3094879 RepID=UPI0029C40992|nr:hypothetical protein [Bacillus cereus group sp. BfR-BA-01233]MDX5846924.1 hypothetical protein [Bacillus cereus group sp. BfR-BA-01233]
MDIKPFDVTLDRLTILGTIKNPLAFQKYLAVSDSLERIETQNVNYDRSGILLPALDEGSAYFQYNSRDNKIRIEFNPKHARGNRFIEKAYKEFVDHIEDRYFSRIDIALDYEFDFFQYKILDLKPNRTMKPYIRNGKIETIEFGMRSSDLQIVMYDKIKERKAKDKEFKTDKTEYKRVEVRIGRSEFVDRVLDDWGNINPFDGIKLLKNEPRDGFKTAVEKAAVMGIVAEPSILQEMDKRTRSKYKKLLDLMEQDEVDLSEAWRQAKSPILAEIRAWAESSQRRAEVEI